MELTRTTLALAALLAALPAHAGYANLAPPPGWTVTGTQGYLNVQAANASVMNGRAVANVTTSVGGRVVTMPASMRFAANAGQFAMNALRINPALMVASVAVSFAATYGLEYAEEQGWLKWDTRELAGWCYKVSDVSGYGGAVGCSATAAAAAADWVARMNATNFADSTDACWVYNRVFSLQSNSETEAVAAVTLNVGGCGSGSSSAGTRSTTLTKTPASVLEPYQRPAEEPDFVVPNGDPVPDALPEVVPVPLPVELPIINPSPAPVPLPQPLRVPLGEPVPVPGTDPQQYRQPVADIVPANRPNEPWRVDLQPKDLLGTDPEGVQDPETVGEGSPGGSPTEEQKQLCDAFPDIAACKPLGDPGPAEVIPTIDVQANVDERVSFGPDTMACPAPRQMQTALAGTLTFEWTGMCQYADGIRPIVIGMAYLGAVLSFFGFGFGFGGRD